MKIRFENVSFGYDMGRDLFRNFNFECERGEIIVVSGSNGSGKTSLIHLVLGMRKNYRGNIFLNERELRRYNRKELSSMIGICFQKTPIFNDSVINNIILQRDCLRQQDVLRLCNRYKLLDGKEIQKNDLEKVITRQNGLSGGQVQKIGILRVLSQNAPIMIFDEPTSNLDYESKEIFLNNIKEICLKKTVIIVSHDYEVINFADKVINTQNWEKI